jgi:hypothetical protein
MKEEIFWKTFSLLLIGILIVTGTYTLVLYGHLTNAEERYRNTIGALDDLSYSLDMLINYGNGTRIWYNGSRIPIGYNLYNATILLTQGDMKATYYPQFQAHFIEAINGVGGDSDKVSWSWIAWRFDKSLERWEPYEVSADQVVLGNGDTIAWHYEDTLNYPNYDPPI